MYMAPELLKKRGPPTPESDVWSLGLLFYFMLYGRHYFSNPKFRVRDQEALQAAQRNFSGKEVLFDDVMATVSHEAKDLLCRMIEADPGKRIQVSEIFEHPLVLNDQFRNSITRDMFSRTVSDYNPKEEFLKEQALVLGGRGFHEESNKKKFRLFDSKQ
jgi:serine/threonine-protein kinase HSL1, negative regulator of Swe1 kinase